MIYVFNLINVLVKVISHGWERLCKDNIISEIYKGFSNFSTLIFLSCIFCFLSVKINVVVELFIIVKI